MTRIKKDTKITVIGDGGWGTTLALMLAKQGYKVSLWGPFADYLKILDKKRRNPKFLPGVVIPREISFTADINQAVEGSRLVVLAVPSHFLRQVLEKLRGKDYPGVIFLSAVKGIENDTLLRMSELAREVLGEIDIAALSGPNIAYEVARGIPATSVAASSDITLAEAVQDVLMSECFRVYTTADIIGVELGGALKNIIAIACGISDGLQFGANTKAAILSRGLVEISRLGQTEGADPKTFSGLSGVGDLVTTCISTHGRNRWLGEQIGKGKKIKDLLSQMQMVAEGVRTTKSAYMLAQRHNIEMPITEQIYQVLYEDKDPKTAVSDLMLREKKSE